MESQKKAPTSAQPAARSDVRQQDELVEPGGEPFAARIDPKTCLDPALTIEVVYQMTPRVYGRLWALAVLMDRSLAARPFATALRSLLAEVECVLP